jgi:hypothetical protein
LIAQIAAINRSVSSVVERRSAVLGEAAEFGFELGVARRKEEDALIVVVARFPMRCEGERDWDGTEIDWPHGVEGDAVGAIYSPGVLLSDTAKLRCEDSAGRHAGGSSRAGKRRLDSDGKIDLSHAELVKLTAAQIDIEI